MHTPGPWEVIAPDATVPSRAIVCAMDRQVDIYDAPLTEETNANARAAGPGGCVAAERMRGGGVKEIECYYGDPDVCTDETWECQTCGEAYCTAHWHETEKGTNVECVACERERKEAARADG